MTSDPDAERTATAWALHTKNSMDECLQCSGVVQREKESGVAVRVSAEVCADLASGLLEAVFGLSVLELDGTDAAQVVQVPAQLLRAARRFRPLCLAPQLLRLAATHLPFTRHPPTSSQETNQGLGLTIAVESSSHHMWLGSDR